MAVKLIALRIVFLIGKHGQMQVIGTGCIGGIGRNIGIGPSLAFAPAPKPVIATAMTRPAHAMRNKDGRIDCQTDRICDVKCTLFFISGSPASARGNQMGARNLPIRAISGNGYSPFE